MKAYRKDERKILVRRDSSVMSIHGGEENAIVKSAIAFQQNKNVSRNNIASGDSLMLSFANHQCAGA
jgi:hypothetical protein